MTTEYLELYKKYRPQRWQDLIGQQKTAKTLQHIVKSGNVPTGLGFFGDRGTGKTSAAFILAKALNCENLTKDFNPCNECEMCTSIDLGDQLGVHYMSMANGTSATDVRDLVQKAWLNQPLKKQVWILDEVHNLSLPAFDAMLIPLEKSDMPSLFILCSTAVRKIPSTIISRIQSRKFTTVSSNELQKHLELISQKEGLKDVESAINYAVRNGHGSVRDTISAFESVIHSTVEDHDVHGELLTGLSQHDTVKAMAAIAHADSQGVDPYALTEQLLHDLRNLLLTVAKVDDELIGALPVSNVNEIAKGFVSRKGILLAIEEIGDAFGRISLGAESRINLEVAITKLILKLERLKKARDSR